MLHVLLLLVEKYMYSRTMWLPPKALFIGKPIHALSVTLLLIYLYKFYGLFFIGASIIGFEFFGSLMALNANRLIQYRLVHVAKSLTPYECCNLAAKRLKTTHHLQVCSSALLTCKWARRKRAMKLSAMLLSDFEHCDTCNISHSFGSLCI